MDIARNALLAYAFQLNKAVIGYETWDIDNVIQADSPHDVLTKLNMELNMTIILLKPRRCDLE